MNDTRTGAAQWRRGTGIAVVAAAALALAGCADDPNMGAELLGGLAGFEAVQQRPQPFVPVWAPGPTRMTCQALGQQVVCRAE
jgi:hypothetical protein